MTYTQMQTTGKTMHILKDYLERHALTRKEFAAGVGCAPSVVTPWLSGKYFVLPVWACKIERFTKGEILAVDLVFRNY